MEIRTAAATWRRIGLAAIRLAALYAVAMFALLIGFVSFVEGLPLLSDLAELALPFGITFCIAFLILAVARRAGFVALWIVLLSAWVWLLRDGAPFVEVPKVFIGWTILALPLFAIGALGSSGRDGRWPALLRRAHPLVVLAVWLVIAGVALYSALNTPYMHWYDGPTRFGTLFSKIVWIPTPFVIAALEITRIWLATSPDKPQAAAA